MRGQAHIMDFGRVKIVAPAPLTSLQWSGIRAAMNLAAGDHHEAADLVLEGAGLLVWPERKRRTTRSWTPDEERLVLAKYDKMDSYRLGRSIGRSSTAVEFFLAQRGLKAMRLKVEVKRGRRTDAPHKPSRATNPDEAYLTAVFKARSQGFAR